MTSRPSWATTELWLNKSIKNLISSANANADVNKWWSYGSSTTEKRISLRDDLWIKPDVTAIGSDRLVSTRTCWFLFDKKLLNQARAVPCTSLATSALRILSCDTLSNAFCRLMVMTSYGWRSEMQSFIIDLQHKQLVAVDFPATNPCWEWCKKQYAVICASIWDFTMRSSSFPTQKHKLIGLYDPGEHLFPLPL